MNSTDEISESARNRFHKLASQFFDGYLDEPEMSKLSGLLKASTELQTEFVLLSELHSALESEPAIQEALANLPENVVSLPGAKTVSPTLSKEEEISSPVFTIRKFIALSMAAIVVIGLGIWTFSKPVSKGLQLVESDAAPAKTIARVAPPQKIVPVDPTDPQEQYQRALLATNLGTGSNQRPPTNFTSEPSATKSEISFNRHVRPILADNCFSCHGPDSSSRKAKLRLDIEDGATVGEKPPIIRGKSTMSELIARIQSSDPDELMPPADSHKVLTAKQKEILAKWIDQGAKWEDHWAFLKPQNQLPDSAIKSQGNAIDFFVDKNLSTSGFKRSKKADRYSLIRRATLDLTGLPPTPDEILSFVNDDSPEAFGKLLDGLFARNSYGEHRARYWLDAARYGDTHGLHLDNYREIWPYRDWVIDAFNSNMSFDQFTIEQIAGDLLPKGTQSQRVATGFNRCNVTTSEGGAIAEEFLVRYAVDRVSTTATVWLGLTAGCCQCHDHKFDPLTMKDFYQLFAYFNNTTQPGMDGNAKDSAPVMRVYASAETEKKAASLRKQIGEEKKKLTALEKAELTATSALAVSDLSPKFTNHGEAEKATDLGTIGNFSKKMPFTLSFRYKLPEGNAPAVLIHRTDPKKADRGWRVVIKNQGIALHLIESWPNKTLQRGVTRRFKPGSSGHFAISYDGSGSSQGIRLYMNGKILGSRFINEWFDTLTDDFSTASAHLLVGGKDPKTGQNPTVNEFVAFERKLTDAEIEGVFEVSKLKAIEKKAADKRSDAEKKKLKIFQLSQSKGEYRNSLRRLSHLETELSKIESRTPFTLIMDEKPEVAKAHILQRGEYDKPGDEVSAAVPAFLPEFAKDLPPNRLGLAKWLVHPDNPLTARVTVNRIWQELFGTGLVKTSEDFGTQGENPSHPELLDWLAVSFIESGWDVKKLYRTIMLSETYQQTSTATPQLIEEDRDNRFLARGPRFRLDAEVIRDQVLFASGLLDQSVGGPA